MAILYIEGWDCYGPNTPVGTSFGVPYGNNVENAVASSLYAQVTDMRPSSFTRTGYGSALYMKMDTTVSPARWARAFAGQTRVIMGFAVWFTPTELCQLMSFKYDNGLGVVKDQLVLFANATNGITAAWRGPGENTLMAYGISNPNVIFSRVWHYIEVDYDIGASGHLEVKVDGQTVLYIPGQVRNPTLPPLINMVGTRSGQEDYFNGLSGAEAHKLYDDIYLLNAEGSEFNSFLGDVVVHGVFPVADAGPNEMAQFGGSFGHFSAVNQVSPDEDSSYLHTNLADYEERFNLNELPVDIISVLAVSVHARARKDAAGQANFKITAALGADVVESDEKFTTSGYLTQQYLMQSKPGGGAWSKVHAQNLEIGFKTV